jgi:hypothetical protein
MSRISTEPERRRRHAERFRKVSNRYPRRVAEAYERDLERAAADSDEQVAATVAAWEESQGLPGSGSGGGWQSRVRVRELAGSTVRHGKHACQMDSSDWIALGALLLAGLSALYARRADQRAERAEVRADEAAKLAKRADERAEREEERSTRANLVVQPVGRSLHEPFTYSFTVRNLGPAVARDIRLWLRDEQGQNVSTITAPHPALAENEDSFFAPELTETREMDQLWVWMRYTDDAGVHEEKRDERPT